MINKISKRNYVFRTRAEIVIRIRKIKVRTLTLVVRIITLLLGRV